MSDSNTLKNMSDINKPPTPTTPISKHHTIQTKQDDTKPDISHEYAPCSTYVIKHLLNDCEDETVIDDLIAELKIRGLDVVKSKDGDFSLVVLNGDLDTSISKPNTPEPPLTLENNYTYCKDAELLLLLQQNQSDRYFDIIKEFRTRDMGVKKGKFGKYSLYDLKDGGS